jgi:hypothetical protein
MTQKERNIEAIKKFLVNVKPHPFNTELLTELQNYSPLENYKATRVYYKCLRRRKFVLASRIKERYKLKLEIDSSIALCFTLLNDKRL